MLKIMLNAIWHFFACPTKIAATTCIPTSSNHKKHTHTKLINKFSCTNYSTLQLVSGTMKCVVKMTPKKLGEFDAFPPPPYICYILLFCITVTFFALTVIVVVAMLLPFHFWAVVGKSLWRLQATVKVSKCTGGMQCMGWGLMGG